MGEHNERVAAALAVAPDEGAAKRLEAAQARIKQIEERRLAKAQKPLEQQIAEAELEAQNAETIERLEDEYGPEGEGIKRVDTRLGMIVVKKPHKLHWDRWENSKRRPEDNEKIFGHSLVYPSRPEANALIDAEPFTVTRCLNAIAELAGVRLEELQGK